MWKTGFQLLDVQFLNDHLIQFGAYQIKNTEFKEKLEIAMNLNTNLYSVGWANDEDFLIACLNFYKPILKYRKQDFQAH